MGGIGKGFAADHGSGGDAKKAGATAGRGIVGDIGRLAKCLTERPFHSVSAIHGAKEQYWQLLIFRMRQFLRRAITSVISSGMESDIIMSLIR